MIKHTKTGIDIEVNAYLKKVKDYYYVILVYKNVAGIRRDKSFPTRLPVRGNKIKAQRMSEDILREFEIPDEDLYLFGEENEEAHKNNKTKPTGAALDVPTELLKNITLDDLTKAQVGNLLFADYMIMYLPYTRKRRKPIEDTTYAGYQSKVNFPIVPYFREQGIRLNELTARDIQEFYDVQMKRVTSGTVIGYHAIIRLGLCYARKNKYITENPIEEVDKPEGNNFVGSFYTANEYMEVIKATKDTKLELAVLFGGFYGMRRGEIVGLRWSAIDFENNVFYINHTITTPRIDGKVQIVAKDRAKTKSSLRAMPLSPMLAERLKIIKARQKMYRDKFGKSYNRKWLEYVMVDEIGNLILPDYITTAFTRVLNKHKLRVIRFHDLRHTNASLLLKNGASIKEIQEWLGHSDYKTTANIYAHLDPSSKKSSLSALSQVITI